MKIPVVKISVAKVAVACLAFAGCYVDRWTTNYDDLPDLSVDDDNAVIGESGRSEEDAARINGWTFIIHEKEHNHLSKIEVIPASL